MSLGNLRTSGGYRQPSGDDNWYPAANGTEVPIKYRSGHTLLYCWNPALKQHAYLNCETDLILSDGDVEEIFAVNAAAIDEMIRLGGLHA
jgi:hypothetical protein